MDWGKKFQLEFDELQNYEFPMDELFELTVNHNKVKYEFLVRLSSNNKGLICFGSGAYNPKKINLPIYDRHSWQNEFKQSVIFYNDPTLYEDRYYKMNECEFPKLTLGWGVGKNDEWYLLNIVKIIKIISKKTGIKSEDTLFFGSSGGGFTSIMLSVMFKCSLAIVNNPQIFCKRYYPIHYKNMLEVCFGPNFNEIEEKYSYRLDVVEWIKKNDYIPNIIYVVNLNSENDIEDQLLPFIHEIKSLEHFDKQLKLIIYSNENGHSGVLGKKETINLIKEQFVNIEELLKSDEIFVEKNNNLKEENYILNELNKKFETLLNERDKEIGDIKSIKGYLNYKIKNILFRLKKKLKINLF